MGTLNRAFSIVAMRFGKIFKTPRFTALHVVMLFLCNLRRKLTIREVLSSNTGHHVQRVGPA